MGGRDLLDQLGAQLVHNLPVRWGCCWVLHPWHVPGGEEEKISDLELEIKFRRTRWTVSTPSSMAWGNRTEWRDPSSRAGWTRTSSTTSRARCGRWGTCTVQTMLCSLTQEPRGEVFIRLEGFQSLLASILWLSPIPKVQVVGVQSWVQHNQQGDFFNFEQVFVLFSLSWGERFYNIFRCKRGVRSATQEFTCDNGYCIPLEKRCDQTEDCRFIFAFLLTFENLSSLALFLLAIKN